MITPRSSLGVMQPVNGPEGPRDLNYYTNGGIGSIGDFDWGDFFGGVAKGGLQIAGNLTDPRFNPGTYSRTDQYGNQIVYAQPTGTTQNVFGSTDLTSNNQARLGVSGSGGSLDMTTIILLGVGLLAIVLIMNKR
jgi:hypothetical protein